jgi:hypothetical protein
VVAMAGAAGMAGRWRRACWFFSGAVWDIDGLGLAVARMAVKYLLSDTDPIVIAVDGTFFKRWGKKVAEARWAYDGSAQGGKKIAFGNYADPPVMPAGSATALVTDAPGPLLTA